MVWTTDYDKEAAAEVLLSVDRYDGLFCCWDVYEPIAVGPTSFENKRFPFKCINCSIVLSLRHDLWVA